MLNFFCSKFVFSKKQIRFYKQDIFYNSNERTRDSAERQLQRAKENLRIKITKTEMELLEKSYWQKESDYQSQIEVANLSQVRLVG